MVLTVLGNGVGVDVGVELRRQEDARWQERVRLSDRHRDIRRRDAARLGSDRIHDDVDLALASAVERRAGDAGNALQRGLDAVERIVVELRTREASAPDRDLDHRRVGRVVLEDEGRQHAERLRNGAHRERRLLLDERLRGVEVGTPLQPDVDDRQVVARDALHVIDAGRRAHVLLDAPRERLLDVLGAQTGRERTDHQHRRRQLRERVDGHARRHDRREDDERQRQHENRDGVAERELRHSAPVSVAATRSPSFRSARPSVTTRDPGAS